MKQTNLPTLTENPVLAGVVFEEPEPELAQSIDHRALELAGVDLLCQLENLAFTAKQQDKNVFVDESGTTVRVLIVLLVEFCDEFLTGKAAAQAREHILKAHSASQAYDRILTRRPLGHAILRTFWRIKESEEVKAAHAGLVDAFVRAFAATLCHAIMSHGTDSPLGKQLDESAVAFVAELKQSWQLS